MSFRPRHRRHSWRALPLACTVSMVAFLLAGATPASAASSSWNVSVVPWSTPGPSAQQLNAVACPAPGTCFAVGDETGVSGQEAPLVESTSGHGWKYAVLPLFPGDLLGIACTSKTACLAVGSAKKGAIVERYNGAHWTASTLPDSTKATLRAIACASRSRCIAVGSRDGGAGEPAAVPAADTWNGVRWTVDSLPATKSAASLSGIACPTTTWCMAVGGEFAYQFAGGTWRASRPSGFSASGVSCTRVGRCVAVGETAAGNAASWTLPSNKWSRVKLPASLADGGGLSGVFCLSPTRCLAVGTYAGDCPQCGNTNGEVLSLNSGKWTSVASIGGGVTGVACTSAAACVAVGYNETLGNPTGQLYPYVLYDLAAVLQSSGETWTDPTLPTIPGPADAWFSAVSCSSARSCAAVGAYQNQELVNEPLVATSSTSGWTATPLPLPAGATGVQLAGVSCVPSLCVAVGSETVETDGEFVDVPLVEELGTSGWTPVAVPTPSGTGANWLAGVSCTSAESCVAVGTAVSSSGDPAEPVAYGELVLTLHGGAWSAIVAPTPAGTVASNGLQGVDCSSSTSCVAVGGAYEPSSYSTPPMIETLSGGTWQPSSAPNPPGKRMYGGLIGVGCSSPEHCLAVGSAADPPGGDSYWYPAAESGPAPWTASSPGLASWIDTGLAGAACPSATTCVAVGTESPNGPPVQTAVAVIDTSGTWSALDLPTPASASGASLSSISCATDTQCTAVGEEFGYSSDAPEVATGTGFGT